MFRLFFLLFFILLSACKVGPNYQRPDMPMPMPTHYKEAGKNWRVAEPQNVDNGAWWQAFHNPELNQLESKVNISNQNIIAAEAQYRQAQALVDEARAGLFPTLGVSVSATRQKQAAFFSNGSGGGNSLLRGVSNDFLLGFNASWVPDLWGGVRRLIEQNRASAQASAAQLAALQLSTQATLAQNYFQLRTLDIDQKLLDDTVRMNQKLLQLTERSYQVGYAALGDVAQARAQLKASQAAAIDNHIARAQLEHAIAVLIGQTPSTFSLPPKMIAMTPPAIPIQIPSDLLERRPDIAQAERQMASANAAIGVAIAAYFPTFTLSGSQGFENNQIQHWLFTEPTLFWSIGPQLAETILDGGLRQAQVAAARAAYQQTVANYRQTVLAAVQNVEDNLAALRILKSEAVVQKQAVDAAVISLNLQIASYQNGTVAYNNVISAENTANTAKKNNADVGGRRMVAAVGLITALGGGWQGL